MTWLYYIQIIMIRVSHRRPVYSARVRSGPGCRRQLPRPIQFRRGGGPELVTQSRAAAGSRAVTVTVAVSLTRRGIRASGPNP